MVFRLVGDQLLDRLWSREIGVNETSKIIQIHNVIRPLRLFSESVASLDQNLVELSVKRVQAMFDIANVSLQKHEVLLVFHAFYRRKAIQKLFPRDYVEHLPRGQT